MPQSFLYRMTRSLFGIRGAMAVAGAMCLVVTLTPTGMLWAGEMLWAGDVGSIVQQAQQQLTIAIQQAEASLQPHQPGSGHTKQHMQQVINVLEGRNGKNFNAKVESPGDGEGVTKRLEMTAEEVKGGQGSKNLQQALDQTMALVQEAIQHAKRSVQGADVHETHLQAGLAAGLLVAAAGRPDSESPITGSLAYAAKLSRR